MSDEWLKDKLDGIETKIDKLDVRVDNVDITLAKQAVVLDEHTRRSLANEEQVSLLREQLQIEIKPFKTHVDQVHAILKLIGLAASIAAIISAVFKILEYFK